MALNEVQVKHMNEVVRPQLETTVLIIHLLRVFAQEHESLQGSADALPEDGTALDDNSDGTAPRSDATAMTGLEVKALYDNCVAMAAELTAGEEAALVSKMVRPLNQVLKVS